MAPVGSTTLAHFSRSCCWMLSSTRRLDAGHSAAAGTGHPSQSRVGSARAPLMAAAHAGSAGMPSRSVPPRRVPRCAFPSCQVNKEPLTVIDALTGKSQQGIQLLVLLQNLVVPSPALVVRLDPVEWLLEWGGGGDAAGVRLHWAALERVWPPPSEPSNRLSHLAM